MLDGLKDVGDVAQPTMSTRCPDVAPEKRLPLRGWNCRGLALSAMLHAYLGKRPVADDPIKSIVMKTCRIHI